MISTPKGMYYVDRAQSNGNLVSNIQFKIYITFQINSKIFIRVNKFFIVNQNMF